MENAKLSDLLARKEIVEWQLTIAKDREIADKRAKELIEIDKQLLKLK